MYLCTDVFISLVKHFKTISLAVSMVLFYYLWEGGGSFVLVQKYMSMYVLFEPWRPIDPVLIPGFYSIKRTGGIHPQDRMLVYRWILPLAMLSTPLTHG